MELIQKREQAEQKERFILAAFIGFQSGAGGKKTFGDYLSDLGLAEAPKSVTKEEALTRAEEILRMVK